MWAHLLQLEHRHFAAKIFSFGARNMKVGATPGKGCRAFCIVYMNHKMHSANRYHPPPRALGPGQKPKLTSKDNIEGGGNFAS
jgi:hypothetical protein